MSLRKSSKSCCISKDISTSSCMNAFRETTELKMSPSFWASNNLPQRVVNNLRLLRFCTVPESCFLIRAKNNFLAHPLKFISVLVSFMYWAGIIFPHGRPKRTWQTSIQPWDLGLSQVCWTHNSHFYHYQRWCCTLFHL